nr:hypothetical protein [uncultured Anaeromusa sp.]
MENITIKDIYAGKPDAKDEINFDGLPGFIKTFIVPQNCNLTSLTSGNTCFISGYKGTGKTALLFYLDNLIRECDHSACSSFIFFKEEFSSLKKNGLDEFLKREISSIIIEKETLVDNSDFEYIWRWLLYKRIVADNEKFNNGLFVDDDAWNEFTTIISKIKGPANIKKSIIPDKIKLSIPLKDPSGITISPELEVNLGKNNEGNNYCFFIELIDNAENAFSKVTRTDIPYHIFIDELEAYYGDINIFKRDLCLIRDLLFTVKRFNSLFSANDMTATKVICSFRTEIANAISRFIIPKELNKVTSGFEVPLKWNYNNTNSYTHPIIQVLLRRIAISEAAKSGKAIGDKEIISQWFPENIHDIEPSNYILNNSWHKPRDIVRLISSAQNSIECGNSCFSQAVFTSLHKQYSIDSLIEIKEEMRALYTAEEIEETINVFTGFKSVFSVIELKNRISTYFSESIISHKLPTVLNDLYRLGFIGNYFPASQMYRWQHKGDDRLIIAAEWRIMIHQALQGALSVGKKQDYSLSRRRNPEIGDRVIFEIERIIPHYAHGKFEHFGNFYPAQMHISEIENQFIEDINNFLSVGEKIAVVVLPYSLKVNKWEVSKRRIIEKPKENA